MYLDKNVRDVFGQEGQESRCANERPERFVCVKRAYKAIL